MLKFIEKMLVELQILNKVIVWHLPKVGYEFPISHNGKNFDLKPFEDHIPTISCEEEKSLPFRFQIEFTDSDSFLKFLTIKPTFHFK